MHTVIFLSATPIAELAECSLSGPSTSLLIHMSLRATQTKYAKNRDCQYYSRNEKLWVKLEQVPEIS